MEDVLENIRKSFQKMSEERHIVKFLNSCVSEGLIPYGLRNPFNLANDVNNRDFVMEVQNECDLKSSRLLDIFLKQRNLCLETASKTYFNILHEAEKNLDRRTISNVKRDATQETERRATKLKKKLIQLK